MKKMTSFYWSIVIFSSIWIEISSNFHGVRQNIHSRGTHIPITVTNSLAWGITSGFTDRYRCHGNMKMELAPRMKPRAQNVPGNLFVDEGCIDCDVCRWMCPSTFGRKGIKSAVMIQPTTEAEKLLAYAAAVACPTGSIRTRMPDPLMKKALTVFPAPIDPVNLPGVMHMGYHSAPSYGATSYLITRSVADAQGQVRPANILVDVSRYNSRLAQVVEEEFGGIDKIVITHRDNAHDLDKWKVRFPQATRVIHRADVDASTATCEIKLESGGSWQVASDVRIVHTPGHTAGSLCVMVDTACDTALFSGDHLAYFASKKGLDGFKRYNHGNVMVQSASLRLLAQDGLPFTWILPGHGRMVKFGSVAEKNAAVAAAADAFDKEDPMDGLFAVGYY